MALLQGGRKKVKVNVPSDMLEYWIVLQRCVQCCLLLPRLIPYVLRFISYTFFKVATSEKVVRVSNVELIL